MSKKTTVALILLVVLIILAVIVAIDIFTDYLGHFLGIDYNYINWDKYFGGITTAVIFGACFLIAVAVMATTFYHNS